MSVKLRGDCYDGVELTTFQCDTNWKRAVALKYSLSIDWALLAFDLWACKIRVIADAKRKAALDLFTSWLSRRLKPLSRPPSDPSIPRKVLTKLRTSGSRTLGVSTSSEHLELWVDNPGLRVSRVDRGILLITGGMFGVHMDTAAHGLTFTGPVAVKNLEGGLNEGWKPLVELFPREPRGDREVWTVLGGRNLGLGSWILLRKWGSTFWIFCCCKRAARGRGAGNRLLQLLAVPLRRPCPRGGGMPPCWPNRLDGCVKTGGKSHIGKPLDLVVEIDSGAVFGRQNEGIRERELEELLTFRLIPGKYLYAPKWISTKEL